MDTRDDPSLHITLSVVGGDCMGGHLAETEKKTEAQCHNSCGMIKIPPCSKALSTEHRPFTCKYILERD